MTAPRMTLSASLLGLAGLAVFTLGGCAGDRDHDLGYTQATAEEVTVTAPVRALADTPFERLWDLRFPSPVWTCYVGSEVPETMFFQLQSGEIAAVDSMSGHTRWITEPLPELLKVAPHAARTKVASTTPGVTINEDRLYVVAQDVLTTYDITTGQIVWSYTLPFGASTGPCGVGADNNVRVFIGDWSGYVRVVTIHPEKRFPYVAWQWNLGASPLSQPIRAEDQVYLADNKGMVHSFRLDRNRAWGLDVGGAVQGSPAVRGRNLFVGGDDNVFYALNRLTGEEFGRITLNGPVKRQPLVFDTEPERVFVWVDSTDVGGLYSIRAQNDLVPGGDGQRPPREVVRFKQEWYLPRADALVASTPQYLYVTRSDKPAEVLAVSRANGRVDWRLDLAADQAGKVPAYVASYQDASDQMRTIITAQADGQVVAYRFFGYVPVSDNGKAADKRIEAAKPAVPADAPAAAAAAPAADAVVPAAAVPAP